MLFVYAQGEWMAAAQAFIDGEPRLDEWVSLRDAARFEPEPSAWHMVLDPKRGIGCPLDWHNVMPPYLLPEELPFSRETFLGLIYARLGNMARARELLQAHPVLLDELEILDCLREGLPVPAGRLSAGFSPFDEYRLYHNKALLLHYACTEADFNPDEAAYFYQEALGAAPNAEFHAFTARQFAVFLLDAGQPRAAEALLEDAMRFGPSQAGQMELKAARCQVWMKQLNAPYDPALLERLKQTLWEVVQHYQAQGREAEEALALLDAGQIANYSNSFAESLGYLNRALDIFRRENMEELLGQAHYRRGILLYTWARAGNPQFFKGAMESFQEALKVFTRSEAPEVFAEIHQYLGVIFSEIPDEVRKKSIWAGVSSASFQEALSVYTRDRYPYEYAQVCFSYANALSRYPEAVHSDNLSKALSYYEEALALRSAAQWPLERALTLLNYVETCWHLSLDGRIPEQALFEDMQAKALEALHLTEDAGIRQEAQAQLDRLEKLREALAAEN
jgi:tetratricopeptide (TPR) repeat protein